MAGSIGYMVLQSVLCIASATSSAKPVIASWTLFLFFLDFHFAFILGKYSTSNTSKLDIRIFLNIVSITVVIPKLSSQVWVTLMGNSKENMKTLHVHQTHVKAQIVYPITLYIFIRFLKFSIFSSESSGFSSFRVNNFVSISGIGMTMSMVYIVIQISAQLKSSMLSSNVLSSSTSYSSVRSLS